MLDDLRELYQEVILDHGRNPRNHRQPEDANREARGDNPICGDRITVYLKIGPDETIEDAAFVGRGCAISQASASMMTEEAEQRTVADVDTLSQQVQEMLTHEGFDVDAVEIGDLEALSGVAKFPVRIKCALLAWKVLDIALAEARGEQATSDSDIPVRIASTN